ncbi:MAG: HAD family hydrolase [Spirochaetes bacterium]|nr:HAD family hydrolase [Spirochaetota bacterium]
MPTSKPVAGIIFDLDGTLADTIVDLAGAVNTVLSFHGLPVFGILEFKLMVGDGFSTLIKRTLPPAKASNTMYFESIVSEARSRYAIECLRTTKPFKGIPELLADFTGRGIACAVLSNKPQEMTQVMVKSLFPGIFFTAVLGERPGVPRKPDPYSALEIARSVGIQPESWAFVGDSGVDMMTGKAAGMRPWGALWGYRGREELLSGGAETIFETPADLLILPR